VHAYAQRLVSVVKMANVLEKCTTEQQRSAVFFFCGQRDSMQRTFITKCFLFTLGSVCSVNRFTTGSRNSVKDVRKSQVMKRRYGFGRDNSQRIICCGFRRSGKEIGQMYQCWRRIWKNKFSPCSNITCFTFYIHL
jgi:hypothetical protein